MASEREVQIFKDLLGRWVEQSRAKQLIIKSREWMPAPSEWLAQGALRKHSETFWDTKTDFVPQEQEVGRDKNPSLLSNVWEIWSEVVQWWENIVGGAISNIPSIVWNTFWFLADVVTPKEFEWLWDFFRERGIKDKQGIQEILWVDPDAFTTEIWEVWSEIATLFTPTGAAGAVAKLWEKAPIVLQGLKNLASKTDKLPGALKSLLWSSAKWATEVGKFEVVSEWEVTQEGLKIWAIANPILKWVWTIWKGILNKFGWERTIEEIAWNILQPTWKGGSSAFESAKEWLDSAIRNIGKKDITDIVDYKSLLNTIKKEKNRIFKPLDDWLKKITWQFKDDSVTDALTWLSGILKTQPWKKFKDLAKEVDKLANKNLKDGLTLPEIQKVKLLHTQNNRLFTESGKEASWVSSDALREVRKDLKLLIEKEAAKQWFKDVASVNSQYSSLIDAEWLIQTQLWKLTNYLGREWKQTFLQNVAEFVTELPWVKQAITQPMQTVFWKVFKTLRAGKINPLEVEKQLPQLIKELRKSWVPEQQINTTMKNIVDTLKIIGTVESVEWVNSLIN